jgi:hypothetical protein
MHTSVSSIGMHHRHRGSSTSVDVAFQCSQTRSHLSLAQLLLPLPASFDRYHGRDHNERHHFGFTFDESGSSDAKQQLRMTVVMLLASPSCDSGDCPLQIASSGSRDSKTLRFAWSRSSGQETWALSDQQPPMLQWPHANSPHVPSSTPPTVAPTPTSFIALHRTSACLSAASSPPFFSISDTLGLTPYPPHRHISLLPPCAIAQVHFCVSALKLTLPYSPCRISTELLCYNCCSIRISTFRSKPAIRHGQSAHHLCFRSLAPPLHLHHVSRRVFLAQGALPSFARGIILADPSVFTPETTSLSSLLCKAIFAHNFLPVILPVNILQQLRVNTPVERNSFKPSVAALIQL